MKKLKEKLNAKLSKNGGFTLVEMLIVVAIIAILVAVSIPVLNSSLDNAKKAVDDANLRAAVGAATVQYLSATTEADATTGIGSKGGTAYYTITKGQGELTATQPAANSESFTYGKKYEPGKGIKAVVAEDGKVTTSWDGGKT